MVASRERLARLEPTKNRGSLVQDVERIARRNAARSKLDTRSADEILGYDEWGLPG